MAPKAKQKHLHEKEASINFKDESHRLPHDVSELEDYVGVLPNGRVDNKVRAV